MKATFVMEKTISRIIEFSIIPLIIYAGVFVSSIFYDIHKNTNRYNYEQNIIQNNLSNKKICHIFHCNSVIKQGLLFTYDKNSLVYETTNFDLMEIRILNSNIYFDFYQQVFSVHLDKDLKVLISNQNNLDAFIFHLEYTFPFILLIIILLVKRAVREDMVDTLISTAGSEALLHSKSMINITENIHHEMNTPLEVIDNKILHIQDILKKSICEECRNENKEKMSSLDEDFEFVKIASQQIFFVLDKMKDFKHLRYSNGNKSIHDIVNGAFKIISISNTNFTFKIDEKLKKYKIASKNLANADFLSILLNHIKNSLEANADTVFVLFRKFEKNTLYMRLLDNGSGIPEHSKSKIFDANFSTKKTSSGIRGNGMFLNRQILSGSGGCVKLISTSKLGTTFEITIPSKVLEIKPEEGKTS